MSPLHASNSRLLTLAVIAVATCGWVWQPSLSAESELPGVPAREWDAVFARTSGWTGADAVYSIDLGGGRTLWLFGDTWIGSIVGGRHAPGSRLVNNSIGVHRPREPDRARPPVPGSVEFRWGPPDPKGKPTAWIVPDPAKIAASGVARRGVGGVSKSWYWPLDGTVVRTGVPTRRELVLFLSRIGRRPGDHGVWGFKALGGAVAVVTNPRDRAQDWRIEQYDNPHAIGTDEAAANPKRTETSWGAAVLCDPAAESPPGDCLYIYGVRETSPLNKQLLLARVSGDRVTRFDDWRFLAAGGDWSSDPARAVPVAEHVANELSVERVEIAGHPMLVMVHSEPVFGTRIMVRTSRRPEGPWSDPVHVYDVPDVKRHKKYFTYAAKGHAHLSRAGHLLISYVVNAHDFGAMIADASIYRPRFVRVKLDRLPAGR